MILMCSHDNRMLLAKPDPSQCREERISVSSIIVVFPQVFIFFNEPLAQILCFIEKSEYPKGQVLCGRSPTSPVFLLELEPNLLLLILILIILICFSFY